jgi:enoyl-CoA hydratase
MESLVLRRNEGPVAWITLNRPEKRNAINRALFRQFRDTINEVGADDQIGLVVISGEGDHFCAGHDLAEKPHPDAVGWIRREMQTLESLTKLRQPVIAAVRGTCFTGGLELALSADFIVCDETARFADTHGKWGLVPGWGMSQRLPRRVGHAKALEMMITCRPYLAKEAEAMGLVNQCTAPGELEVAVNELAKIILANSWHSNAENKRLIYNTDGMRLAEGLDHELMRNAGLGGDMATRRATFPGAAKSQG